MARSSSWVRGARKGITTPGSQLLNDDALVVAAGAPPRVQARACRVGARPAQIETRSCSKANCGPKNCMDIQCMRA
ncbi:Uncharacterised protein [Bordetella pertussis]|nr:Uncharacterised protein [Bordetella pertussis]